MRTSEDFHGIRPEHTGDHFTGVLDSSRTLILDPGAASLMATCRRR